jgi:SAM-dependent methyltransferase
LRTDFESRWKSRFERFGTEHSDDAGVAGWSARGLELRVRRFVSIWGGGAAGQQWLDAGCGAGTYTRLLSARGLYALGVDYSFPAVQRAAQRDSVAEYVVGDATRLPVPDHSMDGVLCFGVTQALSGTEDLVTELARTTRSGGEIWIDALNCWSVVSLWDRLRRRLQGRPLHLRYRCPRHLRRQLERSGMETIQLFWLPIAPAWIAGLQVALSSRLGESALKWIPPLGALLSHSFILRAVVR